ncbi:hypothetical protein [Pseudomonas sp. NMI760_13]|uniref:hypothetical protein n=1 Tax=Pseudomonas sp. NMI760_13 TaxID=2903147 RepID=UPI001E321534|nr:hypothetical protein [Pseudomonas sp. NMI760_13]MCE0915668.1 hypothetical protein [Pseudomonas sp. NMI760_13]
MPNANDVKWFKNQFQSQMSPALANTPLTVDFMAAIACQETGQVWPVLRNKGLPVPEILELCVGDTLDVNKQDTKKGRQAFPKDKAALLAAPNGQAMFDIAHQALVDMANHIDGYAKVARNPDKLCHGFGIFQRDLQFFKTDPDYFLQRRYVNFDDALQLSVAELKRGLKQLGLTKRSSLSDMELAAVGIAYNTGGFNPRKGLRQGFFDGKRFYGENLFDFIRLAHTVAVDGQPPLMPQPAPGRSLVPPPSELTAQGELFRVDTREGPLRMRSEPRKSDPAQANVIANLPDGQPVRALTGKARNGFLEVETSLNGALLRGFVAQKFLIADSTVRDIPVVAPSVSSPASGITAVAMPHKPGVVTRRIDFAGAHSLNEASMPQRRGDSADSLRAELAAIVDWLAVDKPSHKRFQPRDGMTFCNIYCHDYCMLAGAYLPRVWWTEKALITLSQGKPVEPLIGTTLREMRANDLFRWLRDFGPDFGWRQTGTLSKLQQAANQGGVALIVARRKADGKSGHIVAVVPETAQKSARRDANGEVLAPLQSQAGARNFRMETGTANWWNGEQFAESAFWIHG